MILVDFAHLCNRYIFTTISSAKPKKINGKVVTEDISGLFVHGVITNLLYLAKEFSKEYGELVLALEALGYKTNDIKNIVLKVDKTLSIENQIKEALKLLLK